MLPRSLCKLPGRGKKPQSCDIGVVHVSILEQFSPLHGSTLLLPEVRGAFPQPKRRALWQTSTFIVRWEALHWIPGDISTRRAPTPRFSRRETSSHFAPIAVVPTRVPIGFCKKITAIDVLEGINTSDFFRGVLTRPQVPAFDSSGKRSVSTTLLRRFQSLTLPIRGVLGRICRPSLCCKKGAGGRRMRRTADDRRRNSAVERIKGNEVPCPAFPPQQNSRWATIFCTISAVRVRLR